MCFALCCLVLSSTILSDQVQPVIVQIKDSYSGLIATENRFGVLRVDTYSVAGPLPECRKSF
jgi:hypothetical protein